MLSSRGRGIHSPNGAKGVAPARRTPAQCRFVLCGRWRSSRTRPGYELLAEELIGHSDASATMIYTHGLKIAAGKARSPSHSPVGASV
jgi:hypothetical protein